MISSKNPSWLTRWICHSLDFHDKNHDFLGFLTSHVLCNLISPAPPQSFTNSALFGSWVVTDGKMTRAVKHFHAICQVLLNGLEYFYYQTRVSQWGLKPCMGPAPSPEILCVFSNSFPLYCPQKQAASMRIWDFSTALSSRGDLEEQLYSVAWGISVQKCELKMALKRSEVQNPLNHFYFTARKNTAQFFFAIGICCKKLPQVRMGHSGDITSVTPLPSIPGHPLPAPCNFMPCHIILPYLIPSPVSQCWPPHSLLAISF